MSANTGLSLQLPEAFILITEGSAYFFPTQHPGNNFSTLKWLMRCKWNVLDRVPRKVSKRGLTQLGRVLLVDYPHASLFLLGMGT